MSKTVILDSGIGNRVVSISEIIYEIYNNINVNICVQLETKFRIIKIQYGLLLQRN